MKNIAVLILIFLFISGCSTTNFNRLLGTGYNGICPTCKKNIIAYDTTSRWNCCYCGATIYNSEAIQLYNQFGNKPQDPLMCPKCNTIGDGRFIPNQEIVECNYCHLEFDRAEGKRLFNEYYAKIYPSLISAQMQAIAIQSDIQRTSAQMKFQKQQSEEQRRYEQQRQMQQQILQNIFSTKRRSGTIRPDGLGGYRYEETEQ